VELDTNNFVCGVITEIKISKDKQTRITDKWKVSIDDYNTEHGKQGPSDIIAESQKIGSNEYYTTDHEKSCPIIVSITQPEKVWLNNSYTDHEKSCSREITTEPQYSWSNDCYTINT
jgi:hypothetical protein